MKTIALILGLLLLFSNGWWLYQFIDKGITQSYADQQIYELEETRKQLMKSLPSIVENMPKDKLIEIVAQYSDMDKFEKDGCVWIGWIGLKFDEREKLISVSPIWNYGEQNPRFPNKKN